VTSSPRTLTCALSCTLWLRRLSAALLLGLLALGPFLHAHLGQARTSGFHMDGLQWHSHAVDAELPSLTADDEHEAPAVGVSTSLTRESLDTPQAQDLLHWAFALVLAVLPWVVPRVAIHGHALRAPTRLYLPGQPPPALAPPFA
jgi:hypothetical protein